MSHSFMIYLTEVEIKNGMNIVEGRILEVVYRHLPLLYLQHHLHHHNKGYMQTVVMMPMAVEREIGKYK